MDRFCSNKNAYFYFKKRATIDRTLKDQNEYKERAKRSEEYREIVRK